MTILHITSSQHFMRLLCLMSLLLSASALNAECADCDDCKPRVAIKTNLVHDALLTPDLGVELSIAKRWSIGAEGV